MVLNIRQKQIGDPQDSVTWWLRGNTELLVAEFKFAATSCAFMRLNYANPRNQETFSQCTRAGRGGGECHTYGLFLIAPRYYYVERVDDCLARESVCQSGCSFVQEPSCKDGGRIDMGKG